MKASIFVIALIAMVFMAGALSLNIAYHKRSEKQKIPAAPVESFTLKASAFPIANTDNNPSMPQTPPFKHIVMDLGLSNPLPF